MMDLGRDPREGIFSVFRVDCSLVVGLCFYNHYYIYIYTHIYIHIYIYINIYIYIHIYIYNKWTGTDNLSLHLHVCE